MVSRALRESELPVRVDPVTYLIEIGQYADASREQILALTSENQAAYNIVYNEHYIVLL